MLGLARRLPLLIRLFILFDYGSLTFKFGIFILGRSRGTRGFDGIRIGHCVAGLLLDGSQDLTVSSTSTVELT